MWDCFELLQVNETQMETYLIEKKCPNNRKIEFELKLVVMRLQKYLLKYRTDLPQS